MFVNYYLELGPCLLSVLILEPMEGASAGLGGPENEGGTVIIPACSIATGTFSAAGLEPAADTGTVHWRCAAGLEPAADSGTVPGVACATTAGAAIFTFFKVTVSKLGKLMGSRYSSLTLG